MSSLNIELVHIILTAVS
jgi:1-phosphatidylinositol-4-phosphate 5-kinase